jgi:hypothetical protein
MAKTSVAEGAEQGIWSEIVPVNLSGSQWEQRHAKSVHPTSVFEN